MERANVNLMEAPVSCENCGLCCMHMRTPPFVGADDPEFTALPEALKREFNAWINSSRIDLLDARGQEDAPCVWLNACTGQCRRYASRPQVCRDFRIGSEPCLAFRKQAADQRLKQAKALEAAKQQTTPAVKEDGFVIEEVKN